MFRPLLTLISIFSISTSYAELRTLNAGEGLPLEVERSEVAEAYRSKLMQDFNITRFEKYGIDHFSYDGRTGKEGGLGLGLLKQENWNDNIFKNILGKTSQTVIDWQDGRTFLDALKEYSSRIERYHMYYGEKKLNCIPKVTIAAHGWRSTPDELGSGEFHGLPGYTGEDGIYASPSTLESYFYNEGVISTELKEAAINKSINFCNTCLIEVYACNISTKFANELAKASQCQVVVATGKASPYYRSTETRELKNQTYSGEHIWSSGAATWSERGRSEWYRATPQGRGIELIKENIGSKYIAF